MSDNDIVISGIAGRFPESSNLDEFWKNLYEGLDLMTDNEDRWPKGMILYLSCKIRSCILYILSYKFTIIK